MDILEGVGEGGKNGGGGLRDRNTTLIQKKGERFGKFKIDLRERRKKSDFWVRVRFQILTKTAMNVRVVACSL